MNTEPTVPKLLQVGVPQLYVELSWFRIEPHL
jgi:hypothetical protein